jgi:hypothetical protein
LPLVDPVATEAVIWVALFTTKLDADFPLNATAVTPVKLAPVITTEVPTGPLPGFSEEIVGGGVIVKFPLDTALATGVVTEIGPVVVPPATVAVICVPLLTVKFAAAVELNLTDVAPAKFVPVMATDVPAMPPVGLKLEIVGEFVIVKMLTD